MTNKICFKVYAYETVEIRGKKGLPNKEEIQNTQVKFDIGQKNDDEIINKDKEEKREKAMKKYNTSGNLRKTMTTSSKTMKDLKNKDCLIF